MCVLGDDVGQSGLAGAGRTIKNQRAEPVRLKHPSQELAGTYEVLLTGEFLERARPHPRRQRLSFFQIGFVDVVKEIDGMLLRCLSADSEVILARLIKNQTTPSPDFPGT